MGQVTRILVVEHDAILSELWRLSDAWANDDVDGMREFVRFFQEDMDFHGRKEEEVLYPECAAMSPEYNALVRALLDEHRELATLVESMKQQIEALDWGALGAACRRILLILPAHILNEEQLLFPAADSLLDRQACARVLRECDAIGSWL